MSKHSVEIGVDGSIRVNHHNDDAPELLQALSVGGGASALGAGNNFASMVGDEQPLTAEQQDQQNRAHKEFYAQHQAMQDRQARLNTATKIAQSLVTAGNTQRRNPEYIANKSHEIANALHDKAGDLSRPDFDAILKEIIDRDTPDQEQ